MSTKTLLQEKAENPRKKSQHINQITEVEDRNA